MAWAVLLIWVLVILFVGAGVMWAAGKEASSAFLSSLIPGSPAWEKKRKREEEKRLGKARIVGSFKIPPSSSEIKPAPQGKRVLATSSSVIEVKSLKRPSPPPPPKDPPLPKGD